MADYVELYFGTPHDVDTDTAIATLGDLLDVRFEPSTAYYADYEAHDGRRHYDLNIGIEEDEDDPADDMPFTQMPYVLTLRGDRDMDAEMEGIGRELIRQLRQRGYLPARLIYGTPAAARQGRLALPQWTFRQFAERSSICRAVAESLAWAARHHTKRTP